MPYIFKGDKNRGMFTNQKLLGVLLILFIIGAGVYFTVSRFKQEISNAQATPTPTPQSLSFLFQSNPPAGKPPTSSAGQRTLQIKPGTQAQVIPQPSPTELPLEKNKKLSQFPGVLTDESLQNKKAVIQTNKGTIQFQIFPETKLASSNFMILAAEGFYNGLTFHRVEEWVIQGGDPNGNGSGGPGYQFQDESVTRSYVKGIVAMANSGPNTNGSQFFILKKDYSLAPNYTIFGVVISGQDIVDKIAVGDVMQKVTIQNLQQ